MMRHASYLLKKSFLYQCRLDFHNKLYLSTSKNLSTYSENINIRGFNDIPGPTDVPVLGTLIPFKLGLIDISDYHHYVYNLFKAYGPIVKERLGHQSIVHLFDPNDIKKVYEHDGKYPSIPPLQPTTALYRKDKNLSLGLGNMNGNEWYKVRHAVQKIMLRPKEVSCFIPSQDRVACMAVNKMLNYKDGIIKNLSQFLGRWILESAGWCCFDKSLGCLSDGEQGKKACKMIEANKVIFEEKLSVKDIYTVALSVFTDGLSTTTPTFLAALYCLAINKHVQEKLYKEMEENINAELPLTTENFSKLPYLRAFVKEVFRFYPVGESVQRLLQADLILSGYQVPAGTYIDLNPAVWLKSEQIFENATLFMPERWLRSTYTQSIHPYVLNPFSIGPRMCAGMLRYLTIRIYNLLSFVGRRLAEQDLYIGIIRIIEKFALRTAESTLPAQKWCTLLTLNPKQPIQFIVRKK